MKKLFVTAGVLALASTLMGQSPQLEVKEIELSNGMQVWLNEDHSQPIVYGAVVVKAGAKDCPDTGLAHYLEHLLFKGTDELGTIDYESEKVYLDSIEACYDKLSQTTDENERLEIQKEINRISIKAADYAIPNEFDLLTAEAGGTGLNAATSYDFTYYYNTFSPQYLAQWAELNSHRMLHPVFRLFQGELETVYEEKNRAQDNIIQEPLFKMIEIFSNGNPYAYQVIGSTENLKNPRLGEMMAFFKKYYVGCNMGLVLSGDIDASTIEPLLEQTFGRIPRGETPVKEKVEIPVIDGYRSVDIKLPIPMIKASVFAFNAPTDKDDDAMALDLAIGLLTNSFSSGLLDSLTTSHKVLASMAQRLPLFNEMGVMGYVVIPSLPFGKLDKAEDLCLEQIEKVKRGEFSDADVETLKLEAAMNAKQALETIGSRSDMLCSVMSQGRSWSEYLEQVESIEDITREDIIRVANKYFTDNYLRFVKVKGKYPKDNVSKPDFDPIIPKNGDQRSEYAKRWEQIPVDNKEPKLVDFENDVERIALNDHVTLFYKENPVNDLYDLTLRVSEGSNEDPLIPYVASYLNTSGTDSLTTQQLAKAWQKMGTMFSVNNGNHSFSMQMQGFDENLDESLQLMRHIIDKPGYDKKGFKELLKEIKLAKKTFLSGGTSNIMEAAQNYAMYGNESEYLTQLTKKDLKKTGIEGILKKYNELMDSECNIFYSGQLPKEEVAAALKRYLDIDRAERATERHFLNYVTYDEPEVLFYDLKGSRQTQMITYQKFPTPETDKEKAILELLSDYIGGGMYSMMFQEVREYRSMAYSAHGFANTSYPADKEQQAILVTELGTQADKTLSALSLVDSLLADLPMKDARLYAAKRSIVSQANNTYPSFRNLAMTVDNLETLGYTEDPDKAILENVDAITMQDLKDYYTKVISKAPMVRVIVGDSKMLDMEEIAKYGKITELKEEDIYR